MSVKVAKDFLAGIDPVTLRDSLPDFQARRAIEVAHLGLPIKDVANSEGVSELVIRKSLGWAAANMERAITEANS